MAPPNGQSRNFVDQHKQIYSPDENSRVHILTKNVPFTANNEISQAQQLVCCNGSDNYLSNNNRRCHLCQQQWLNNQIIHQSSLDCFTPQHYHQQQTTPSITKPPSLLQLSIIHSDINQQRTPLPTNQPPVDITPPPLPTSMTNPEVSSNSRSLQTKTDRNDINGASESKVQSRRLSPVMTRVFYSSNRSNRRRHKIIQQPRANVYSIRYFQSQPVQFEENDNTILDWVDQDGQQQQFSLATYLYATSRYPFMPFTIIFSQEVREKTVVEELIEHALKNFNFTLETVAYRRVRGEDNECRIIIDVENNESFIFLYDRGNWPTTLAGCDFTTKIPSIPPQFSLILYTVPLEIDWNEFVQEIKDKYTDIIDIIRLKNKAQKPVRTVKLEFKTIESRNDVLEEGKISIMHMKHKVYEYRSKAKVLLCSNCFEIGHFGNRCRQKTEVTCKVCGEKYSKLKDHQCSGVSKCIHCDGSHNSDDVKCPVVTDYKAALTRYLIAKTTPPNLGDTSFSQSSANVPQMDDTLDYVPYSTVAQLMSLNSNDKITEKLDNVLAKVEEESVATGTVLGELKEEVRNNYEETKQKVNMLEKQMEIMEKKIEDISNRILQ